MRRRVVAQLLLGLAWAASSRAAEPCTVIADAATGAILMRTGPCDQRVTPASTFKIAISLMGYDSGFLVDEHAPALPFRRIYPDWLPAWRQTTDPARWLQYSVVWYSQQITRSLGPARFRQYVTDFGYGNEDVSGHPGKHDGLTEAWLSSSLKISPLEQVAFLEKLVRRELPVSAHAYEMTDRITRIGGLADGWDLHGKTGSGFPTKPDGSDDREHAYGWFVGWATRGDRTLVFTRLIQDDMRQTAYSGPRARDGFVAEAPALFDRLAG